MHWQQCTRRAVGVALYSGNHFHDLAADARRKLGQEGTYA